MKKLLYSVSLCCSITAAVSYGLRQLPSLSSISLTDYIAYTGIILITLSTIFTASSGLIHSNHQVSMTFRALTRTEKSEHTDDDTAQTLNTTLVCFLSGALFILTSLTMIFLN